MNPLVLLAVGGLVLAAAAGRRNGSGSAGGSAGGVTWIPDAAAFQSWKQAILSRPSVKYVIVAFAPKVHVSGYETGPESVERVTQDVRTALLSETVGHYNKVEQPLVEEFPDVEFGVLVTSREELATLCAAAGLDTYKPGHPAYWIAGSSATAGKVTGTEQSCGRHEWFAGAWAVGTAIRDIAQELTNGR